MTETGTLLQDRYLIEKQIGEGGMGAVYLAIDRRFDNYVAIKETFYTDDEFGEAFEREARLLNGLQHPVLPHVSDFFTENNRHFLVMQYIEGEDLSEILKRQGEFPVEDVLRWTDDLLDALDFLHSQKPPVIHRDIKPQNLKLTPRGGIILLDFGLAKVKHEDTTGVKSVFGYSRRYSPLEQIQGTGTDARSDIFSLGATVYQLLTGKPPVEVLTRATKIIAGKPDPLQPANEINDQVPVKVAAVLHSALALNPEHRFASAAAMRKALDHASVSNENAEEATADISDPLIVSGDQIVAPAKTENFPALAAFADEVKSSEQIIERQTEEIEIPIRNSDADLPSNEYSPPSTSVIGSPIIAGFKPNPLRLQTIAIAVLLTVFAGAAAGYFIYRINSSEQSAESPTVQISPETRLNGEQPAIISDSQDIQIAETVSLTETERAGRKINPIKEIEESDVEAEDRESKSEKSVAAVSTEKTKSSQTETSHQIPTRNTQQSRAETDGDARARVVKSEPVADIESVFTGRPTWKSSKKQQRKEKREQLPDEMSEEEWQELRREHREKRKERQKEKPVPFY